MERIEKTHYELEVLFKKGNNLINCDIGGVSDPYIVAQLCGRSFKTQTKWNTLNPEWNEKFTANCVPIGSVLDILIFDKDKIKYDDKMGSIKIDLDENLKVGETQALTLPVMINKKQHGTLDIDLLVNYGPEQCTGVFKKECIQHCSQIASMLTGINNNMSQNRYCYYDIKLSFINEIFGEEYQEWNRDYDNAQKIFGDNNTSAIVRGGIHTQHKIIISKGKSILGGLYNANDFLHLINYGKDPKRKEPVRYTYIINNDYFRFSETSADFFADFCSKHAVHANAARKVRYCGEFHIRHTAEGKMILVIDNNSGTYSPNVELLPKIEELFKRNFSDIEVEALSREDPKLMESCKKIH